MIHFQNFLPVIHIHEILVSEYNNFMSIEFHPYSCIDFILYNSIKSILWNQSDVVRKEEIKSHLVSLAF